MKVDKGNYRKMNTNKGKILTVPQAAERLQVSERTLYGWLREGMIPGRKIGKVWRLSEEAIVDFLRGGLRGEPPGLSSSGKNDRRSAA
jgi:excisionase family DNA binding protein